MWMYERSLSRGAAVVAGVDEAGRGCLAGPVFAAAVVLGGGPEEWSGLNDSKQLSATARERWYQRIRERAVAVGVGMATVEEIDEWNILHAARVAMGRAVMNLGAAVELLLVDGSHAPLWTGTPAAPSLTVVDGDARCLSVAAASIVAKVERDRHMADLAARYPEYGFDRNAGYGTAAHLQALRRVGPCPAHRRSFGPVRQWLQVRLNVP
ncbi:MAG: ribonuclease HII [Alicyclobacillaceae bacterium]|nr:ribonuclease HII [Alicyclobacillaceae bacterium]